jgi:chromosome segregation ATPase
MASAITYEMVEQACNDLQVAGEKVTYLKVHEHLGQGSTRIVTAHMRRWREERMTAARNGEDPLFKEWPEALVLRARSLFDALRDLSQEAATASIETVRSQMAIKEAELCARASEAEEQREKALDQLRSEQATSTRLQAELDSVRGTLEVQRASIEDLVGQRDRMAANEQVLKERLTLVQQEHNAHVRKLGEQARSERERLIEEVKKEQERAAGEREHLMQQTDRLRQDYAAQVLELRNKLVSFESKEARLREQVAEANGLNREQLSTIRQLEARVAESAETLVQAQRELSALKQTQAADAARLQLLEAQLVFLEKLSAGEADRAKRAEERLQEVTLQRILQQGPVAPDAPPDTSR